MNQEQQNIVETLLELHYEYPESDSFPEWLLKERIDAKYGVNCDLNGDKFYSLTAGGMEAAAALLGVGASNGQ